MNILILHFCFERQFPAMNILILHFCLEWQFPAMNILISIYIFCFEWQFLAVNISIFFSAFISLLLLFSFDNKNVLFCLENNNNNKKNLFSIQ